MCCLFLLVFLQVSSTLRAFFSVSCVSFLILLSILRKESTRVIALYFFWLLKLAYTIWVLRVCFVVSFFRGGENIFLKKYGQFKFLCAVWPARRRSCHRRNRCDIACYSQMHDLVNSGFPCTLVRGLWHGPKQTFFWQTYRQIGREKSISERRMQSQQSQQHRSNIVSSIV